MLRQWSPVQDVDTRDDDDEVGISAF
jgi:hypothetical protein